MANETNKQPIAPEVDVWWDDMARVFGVESRKDGHSIIILYNPDGEVEIHSDYENLVYSGISKKKIDRV